MAFIDTPASTGSGILVSQEYLVTNAHVVWPFAHVRVVFPDGSEYADVPVVNWDLMGDLAIVGPIEIDVDPVELVDGEDLIVGSDVFLIGYPGEVDKFPQPTITRGLISRKREWEPIGVTFFQTDAKIAGGQSGGLLVSELGEVIGVSGFTFSDADFALVASASDILPRIEALILNQDVDGLGERRVPLQGGQRKHKMLLHHEWESSAYVINQPIGTEIEIEVDGGNDGVFSLVDVYGYEAVYADDRKWGTERGSTEIELDAPYFLDVYQRGTRPRFVEISSSHELAPLYDEDDGKEIKLGETVAGNLDYPGDFDFFEIYLAKGDVVNVMVDSVLVDPVLIVGQPGDQSDQLVVDDDSGGGLFGYNAELTFEAPHNGDFLLVIQDSYGYNIGGYWLTVDEPYEGAPTPIVPQPTVTPIASEFGDMALYESQDHPFTIEYPASWTEGETSEVFSWLCDNVAVCLSGRWGMLAIVEEDITTLGLGLQTLEEYVDLLLTAIVKPNGPIKLVSRETRLTAQGQPAEVIVLEIGDDLYSTVRFTTIHDGIAFGATYVIMLGSYELREPVIEYSIESFRVTELEP